MAALGVHIGNRHKIEQLSLDGTVITPSTRGKYLSAAKGNEQRFETHIDDKVSSAKQRLHLVNLTNLCDRDIESIR